MTRRTSFHPVKDGRHFTASAGLLATFPAAEAPGDEYSYFAWLLRYEAFLRFGYDPDAALSEKTDEYGFREQGRTEIPGVNLLDFARAFGWLG